MTRMCLPYISKIYIVYVEWFCQDAHICTAEYGSCFVFICLSLYITYKSSRYIYIHMYMVHVYVHVYVVLLLVL